MNLLRLNEISGLYPVKLSYSRVSYVCFKDRLRWQSQVLQWLLRCLKKAKAYLCLFGQFYRNRSELLFVTVGYIKLTM